MTTVQLTLHVANVLMFIISIYTHVLGYMEVKNCRAASVIKRLGKNVMIAGTCISSLFILLQADWIVANHNEAVGDATSWSWLLFDYALSVYLLVMSTLVRVFASWRGGLKNATPRRRHSDHLE